MAVTLLNSSGYTWGIASDEVGIKAATFNVTVAPEFREPRMGLQNAIEGWAVGPNQVNVSLSGDISGATGIMAATFIAAYTAANSITHFGGAQSGVLFLTTATVNNERGSWKNLNAELQSNSGVTAA